MGDIMKLAIIGSRSLYINDLSKYIPSGVSEIVSGGVRGIDTSARNYALKNGIKLTEFLPNYRQYGRIAPLKRNIQIVDYADKILAFWDGKSTGTVYTVRQARLKNKKVTVYRKIVT